MKSNSILCCQLIGQQDLANVICSGSCILHQMQPQNVFCLGWLQKWLLLSAKVATTNNVTSVGITAIEFAELQPPMFDLHPMRFVLILGCGLVNCE
jgi:hypothetical protein